MSLTDVPMNQSSISILSIEGPSFNMILAVSSWHKTNWDTTHSEEVTLPKIDYGEVSQPVRCITWKSVDGHVLRLQEQRFECLILKDRTDILTLSPSTPEMHIICLHFPERGFLSVFEQSCLVTDNIITNALKSCFQIWKCCSTYSWWMSQNKGE